MPVLLIFAELLRKVQPIVASLPQLKRVTMTMTILEKSAKAQIGFAYLKFVLATVKSEPILRSKGEKSCFISFWKHRSIIT